MSLAGQKNILLRIKEHLMPEVPFKEVCLAEHQPASHDVPLIKLDFIIHDERDVRVTSTMHFRKSPNPDAEQTQGTITLFGSEEHVSLKELKVDGKKLGIDDYSLNGNGELTIHRVPDEFSLEIQSGLNPKSNKSCMGLYVSEGIFCTQCEPEGFRNITYSLDRPDVYSRFEVSIEADAKTYTSLLSNGAPNEEKLVNGRRKITWVDNRPKPTYLFAICVGDFDTLNDKFVYPNGREITLQYFVNKGDMKRAHWAMACLKDAMMHEYDRWGHGYHSDSELFMTIAVDTFVFGAMENTGLNIFNSTRVLADPETATDARYQSVDLTVDHEFAHDETGNRRVPNSWFQISYKEGLTVLREQTYLEDKYGFAEQRIKQIFTLRSNVFSYDTGPMSHPMVLSSYLDIQNNYDVITYPKGAEVNRMVQTLVGKDKFKKAYREYHDVESTTPATIKSWLEHVATSTGKDLRQFIDAWLNQSGVPTLEVTSQYNDAKQCYWLTVKQRIPTTINRSDKNQAPFHMPFVIGLVGKDGKDVELTPADDSFTISDEGMIELTKEEQTFTFCNVTSKPLPSLNRDFSAYAKIEIELSRDDLSFLAVNDTNAVNRWSSAQQLALIAFQDAIEAVNKGREVTLDSRLPVVFKAILADKLLSDALKAEMLKFPEEAHVNNLQERGRKDPIATYKARKILIAKLGAALECEFREVYESSQTSTEYTPSPLAMGRRSLMNLCLYYLVNSQDGAYVELAKKQFERQANYNDTLHALSLLASSGNRETGSAALNMMLEKYKSNNIVMNDWLEIHAQHAMLDEIKNLTKHPVFSYHNPNKVRSLIGVFANKNTMEFHKEDGSGYEFVADQVIKINSISAKVSSDLLKALTKASDYSLERKKKMIEQLERILTTLGSNVSKNIYEIVSKTLQESGR
jgi:aminopeptidase N